jgi:hypothetical protein
MGFVALVPILVNTTMAVLLSELLKASGRAAAARPSGGAAAITTGVSKMGEYDIVGLGSDFDDDDDDVGAIGDLLIGLEDDDDDDISGIDDDDDEEVISGDEEDAVLDALVSGMGDTEIVGKKRKVSKALKRLRALRRARALKKKRARALKRKLAHKNAGAVIKRGLERRRRYPLGFVPTSVTSGTTQNVPAAPQNLFRPERLVIPSDIAFDFGVPDIKIGNMSQLVQDVELPGAIFSEVAIDTGVHFDTAEVGNQISCRARNKSGITIEFSAAVLGTIAK